MLPALRRVTSLSHSFRPFLKRPFKSSTTQRRFRLQHGYCIGVSHRNAQATAGKELAQGPYVAARAGVEPTTLRLKVIVSTKVPPRPTKLVVVAVLKPDEASKVHPAIKVDFFYHVECYSCSEFMSFMTLSLLHCGYTRVLMKLKTTSHVIPFSE